VDEEAGMTKRATRCARPLLALGLLLPAAGLAGCMPTVHVQIDPITINARLDADVRIKLDREVEQEIQQNPNLF